MADNSLVSRVIDDSDPLVTGGYSNGWVLLTSDWRDWNHTSHATRKGGASLVFRFNGTQINVFGTSDGSGGSSNYTLDGGLPSTYIEPDTFQSSYRVPFYTSPEVPYGEHNLTVTSVTTGSLLRLDYFVITTNSSQYSTLPFSTNPVTAGSGTKLVAVGSLNQGSQSISTAVIVGIVAGSVVGLLLAIIGIVLLCRHIRAKRRPHASLAEKGFDILDGEPITSTFIHGGSLSSAAKSAKGPTVSSSQGTSTSQAQSSTMFTSVVILSPVNSISEHSHANYESGAQ